MHRVARTLHLSPQKPYEILKQNCAFKTSRVHALPRHGCVLESRPWGFPWACPGLALGCCTCPAPSLPRTCHSPEPSLDRGKLMGIACTEPALDPSAKSQSCTESRKIPRQELCARDQSAFFLSAAITRHSRTRHSRTTAVAKVSRLREFIGYGSKRGVERETVRYTEALCSRAAEPERAGHQRRQPAG